MRGVQDGWNQRPPPARCRGTHVLVGKFGALFRDRVIAGSRLVRPAMGVEAPNSRVAQHAISTPAGVERQTHMSVMHDDGKGGFFVGVGLLLGAAVGALILASPEKEKAKVARGRLEVEQDRFDKVEKPRADREQRDDDRSEADREKKAKEERKARKNAARGRNP